MEQIVTAEQIAKHYSALLDSVALINAGKQEGQTDEEWADCLVRNQEHCRIMLAKEFWTDQDLSVVEAVV